MALPNILEKISNTTSTPSSSSGGFPNILRVANPTQTNQSYWEGVINDTSFGPSKTLDTSGIPLLDYRQPNDTSTTTDMTRVIPKFNPSVATTTPASLIQNKRDTSIRGTVSGSELDHSIPLELAGSNQPQNLKYQPGIRGGVAATSDTLENQLARDVQAGKISLFDAQTQIAKQKGLPVPVTGTKQATPFPRDDTTFNIIKNTILGIPKALWNFLGPGQILDYLNTPEGQDAASNLGLIGTNEDKHYNLSPYFGAILPSILKIPTTVIADIAGIFAGPQTFNVLGVGEVANIQQQAKDAVLNGQNPFVSIVNAVPQSIFDGLMVAGFANKVFSPRQEVIARGVKTNDLPAVDQAPPVKSFRITQPPTSQSSPIPEEAITKLKESGADIRNYDPKLPTYLRTTPMNNGVIKGEIVQVRPSYFDTFRYVLKGDIAQVPPEETTPVYTKTTTLDKLKEPIPPEGASVATKDQLVKEAIQYPSAENFSFIANQKYGISSDQATSIWNEANQSKAIGQPSLTPSPETTISVGSMVDTNIGKVEVIDGVPTVGNKKGYGLSKIQGDHPDVVPLLPEALRVAKIVEKLPQRDILEGNVGDKTVRIIIDHQLGKEPKTFLNNAYVVSGKGLEPSTSSASTKRSTIELPKHSPSISDTNILSSQGVDNIPTANQGVVAKIKGEAPVITTSGDKFNQVTVPEARPQQTQITLQSGFNPGLDKFIEQDIKPATKGLTQGILKTWDYIKKVFNPSTRGPEAEKTASIFRESLAKMARDKERTYQTLAKARSIFDKYSEQESLAVIDGIETGNPVQGTEQFAQVMRQALDARWAKIQTITGTDRYIEHFFPHLWEDPALAEITFAKAFGKRPLEGSRAHTKERTIPTIKEGIALGLKPVTFNPVDLVMAKIADEDRFIMAHDIWEKFKAEGLNKFIKFGGEVPQNWRMVDDRISKAFYKPTFKESFDAQIMDKLNALADSLGIKHERVISGKGLGGKRLGVSFTGENLVKTKVATPEDILIHEIGHQIDDRYGLQSMIPDTPLYNEQMRKLADLRYEGKQVSDNFKKYVRKGEEKMAVMFQAYLHAPDKFREVAPQLFDSFEKFINRHDELKPILDIKPSLVYGTQVHETPYLVQSGSWYMPEKAVDVVNNYLSPGLTNNPIYNAFRMLGNSLNQVQLGISGYHAFFTSGDAVISKASLELQKAFTSSLPLSERLIALGKAISTPITAPYYLWQNIIRGNSLLVDYFKDNPQIPGLVNALERAGGRVRMDRIYKNNSVENFLKAVRSGNLIGGILKTPGAVIEALAKPLMEELVPRQKLGVFADGAKYILKQAQDEQWSEYKTTLRLQEMWDSVDNRMGQLVYDNLFWNKVVKDLGMVFTRSLGWNLGTFRELGGGIRDITKVIPQSFKGEARFTPKMGYAFSLPYIIGLWGAIIYYLYNHRAPSQLLDYFYPSTGKTKPDGTPERISLPSYMKDVFAYKTEATQTIANKIHPEIATILDMLSNKDYFGTEIRNPTDPLVKQAEDLAIFQLKQFVPFTITNLIQRKQAGDSWGSYLQSFAGISPAPGYITRTPLQTEIYNLYDLRNGSGTKSQETAAVSKAKAEVRDAYYTGDTARANELLGVLIKNGTVKNVAQFIKNADTPNDIKLFSQLPSTDQAGLVKKMELYQLNRYAWYVNTDLKSTFSSLSDNAKIWVEMVRSGEIRQPIWKKQQEVKQ